MRKSVIKTLLFLFVSVLIIVIVFQVEIKINNYKMSKMTLEQRLEKVYKSFEKKIRSGGIAYRIEKKDGSFMWSRETGNLTDNRQYALASITKMYTTAVVLNLADNKQISLDDKIDKYLEDSIVDNLNIYKDKDYSHEITIRQLLSHTSGIADYYTESSKKYKAIEKDLTQDPVISFDDVLERTKALKPHFIPGEKGKAYYSDFNFDLLKVIIENITGKKLEENYQEYVFKPLNLKHTCLFKKDMETYIPEIWIKGSTYVLNNILASAGASGGMVSNITDNMVFLKAFMEGVLFDSSHYREMNDYNRLQFYPLQYGMGVMQFASFGAAEIVGHSGSTGTVSYYCPEYNVYIVGAINEQDSSKCIRQVCKLLNCFAYESK